MTPESTITQPWAISLGARGIIVADVQKSLGLDGDVFNVTMRDTLKARHGSSEITPKVWSRITKRALPALIDRCVALTAAFDDRSWGTATGNLGGIGASFGVLSCFNVRTGGLFDVFNRMPGHVVEHHLTSRGVDELRDVAGMMPVDRVRWGVSITAPGTTNMIPTWAARFEALGKTREARKAQRDAAIELWNSAMEQASQIDVFAPALRSPEATHRRIAALAFDTLVTDGKLDTSPISALTLGTATPTFARRGSVAGQDRRLTIALGRGTVKGKPYTLSAMGI
jgi:hypothetical protein